MRGRCGASGFRRHYEMTNTQCDRAEQQYKNTDNSTQKHAHSGFYGVRRTEAAAALWIFTAAIRSSKHTRRRTTLCATCGVRVCDVVEPRARTTRYRICARVAIERRVDFDTHIHAHTHMRLRDGHVGHGMEGIPGERHGRLANIYSVPPM